MSNQALPLTGKEPDTWRKLNSHLFKTDEGFKWFWQKNKAALIGSGAVIVLGNRLLTTDPDKLRDVILGIGRQEAQRLCASAEPVALVAKSPSEGCRSVKRAQSNSETA
ncbi:hypothetical protein NOV72_03281 [Caballeronia novacaledonica]|uniref:Uncharacterized protein n=1 Tax=Caballeronia novacaledonica TaxID=1544861 RepID=A0A2U3I7J1_9BURK|nr:hypothetical protein [Caballeronia novacaledonica]SPB16081.1 hypothetical protein NOV72_03281 [Caballeronia novacaledonica]